MNGRMEEWTGSPTDQDLVEQFLGGEKALSGSIRERNEFRRRGSGGDGGGGGGGSWKTTSGEDPGLPESVIPDSPHDLSILRTEKESKIKEKEN